MVMLRFFSAHQLFESQRNVRKTPSTEEDHVGHGYV